MMVSTLENQSLAMIREVFSSLKAKSLELRSEEVNRRKDRLRALRRWIFQNANQLQEAAYADLAKPPIEFDAIEILYVLSEIKTAIRKLDQWARARPVDAPISMIGTRSFIQYEPRGACLIMSPWNYPFSLCIGPLVSALAAGNTVLLKPSELTPRISSEIKRMSTEIFDPSIVAVVEGGVDIAEELVRLPFDHIFFTGSAGVGKIVMKAAAENLTSVTLELGGKSPAIVTKKAEQDDAAQRIAISKFVNAGQTCVAPDYVLVDKEIAEKFVEKLVRSTQHAFANKDQFPRIVSTRHFERLVELMGEAVNSGARVELNGTTDSTHNFFYPTILTNVPLSLRLMQEEIFGPILPVLTFSDLSEAINIVNNQPKPLGLYLFSRSKRERELVLKNTSSGGVCINDCAIQFLHHDLPFGGVNSSGMGKAHGHSGFLTFSNEKPVLRQRNGFTSVKILYPPYRVNIQKLLRVFMKLFYR
ncbi:MAG TPA: aldehyde dehydrogenase family protein [Cyclobacteriaceae bacterium]|nr:aldehyde dehydrogenase family protein [Cyclobacteriaceae bacterium]